MCRRAGARAYSLEYLLSLGVSSAALPIIAAMHHLGYGFDWQYLMLGGCAAIVFLTALILPGQAAVAALASARSPVSADPRPRRSRA